MDYTYNNDYNKSSKIIEEYDILKEPYNIIQPNAIMNIQQPEIMNIQNIDYRSRRKKHGGKYRKSRKNKKSRKSRTSRKSIKTKK